MVEVILHLVVLRQAEEVAVLHVQQVVGLTDGRTDRQTQDKFNKWTTIGNEGEEHLSKHAAQSVVFARVHVIVGA